MEPSSVMADVVAGPELDDMVSEVDMGRVALTCHFSSDVLCSEMHQPHVFLPQVLRLDVLIPVNEVRKACGIPEPAKSVRILFRGGYGLGVWDLEAHTTLAQWFSGGKRGGDMDGYFSTTDKSVHPPETAPEIELVNGTQRSATPDLLSDKHWHTTLEELCVLNTVARNSNTQAAENLAKSTT